MNRQRSARGKVGSARARVIGLSALALAAAPAIAQNPAAGEIPRAGLLLPRYVAAQRVGGCVVRNNPKVAARYVLAGPGDRSDRASPGSAFVYAAEPCLAGAFASVRLNSVELSGAMAEALLTARDATLLRQARSAAPRKPERVPVPAAGEPNFALFACAVAAMPEQAAELLESPPATPGEAAAFQSIGPALQDCAPANVSLHVKPSNVRWLVATSLYRLVAKG